MAEKTHVGGGDVSWRIEKPTFRCPCCERGTTVIPPLDECSNCGTELSLFVGHEPCDRDA